MIVIIESDFAILIFQTDAQQYHMQWEVKTPINIAPIKVAPVGTECHLCKVRGQLF